MSRYAAVALLLLGVVATAAALDGEAALEKVEPSKYTEYVDPPYHEKHHAALPMCKPGTLKIKEKVRDVKDINKDPFFFKSKSCGENKRRNFQVGGSCSLYCQKDNDYSKAYLTSNSWVTGYTGQPYVETTCGVYRTKDYALTANKGCTLYTVAVCCEPTIKFGHGDDDDNDDDGDKRSSDEDDQSPMEKWFSALKLSTDQRRAASALPEP